MHDVSRYAVYIGKKRYALVKKYGWGSSVLWENALSLGCLRSGTKLTMKAPGYSTYTLCIEEPGASMLR